VDQRQTDWTSATEDFRKGRRRNRNKTGDQKGPKIEDLLPRCTYTLIQKLYIHYRTSVHNLQVINVPVVTS
jgi:hypothetical protein